MSQVSSVLRRGEDPRGGFRLSFYCPGCDDMHAVWIHADGWTFDDDDLERPSFRPSVLAICGERRCHSYITGGRFEYLGDCTHELAGRDVDMVPLRSTPFGDPSPPTPE